jgi:hypothetical protein
MKEEINQTEELKPLYVPRIFTIAIFSISLASSFYIARELQYEVLIEAIALPILIVIAIFVVSTALGIYIFAILDFLAFMTYITFFTNLSIAMQLYIGGMMIFVLNILYASAHDELILKRKRAGINDQNEAMKVLFAPLLTSMITGLIYILAALYGNPNDSIDTLIMQLSYLATMCGFSIPIYYIDKVITYG